MVPLCRECSVLGLWRRNRGGDRADVPGQEQHPADGRAQRPSPEIAGASGSCVDTREQRPRDLHVLVYRTARSRLRIVHKVTMVLYRAALRVIACKAAKDGVRLGREGLSRLGACSLACLSAALPTLAFALIETHRAWRCAGLRAQNWNCGCICNLTYLVLMSNKKGCHILSNIHRLNVSCTGTP